MPICIECRYPLRTLYTTYSKADDRSLGKGVRLTQCPRCKRFGDKYVEHDFVVLFIDLVLIKPQVYRHLLFNRLGREDDRFDPSIVRLGVLLLLFDVYLTWARIEKASPNPFASSPSSPAASSDPSSTASSSNAPDAALLSSQPLVLQYLFFLGLCTAQTLAFHLPIRFLCAHPPRLWLPSILGRWGSSGEETVTVAAGSGSHVIGGGVLPPATVAALASSSSSSSSTTTTTQAPPGSRALPPSSSSPASGTTTPSHTHTYPYPPAPTPSPYSTPFIPLIPHHPHPTPLSTALLVSSCTKLFPLLLIIWDYDLPSSASAVSWAVIVNNVAALEILMDCGYLRAALLVAVGAAVRALVGRVVLGSVGFGTGIFGVLDALGVPGGVEGVGRAVGVVGGWVAG
ncbi:Arv1-like family-domain-containing protein [Phyllosticta citribraziliensis]|uniref:Protein ARV n=1 Tax=Phyllosticta citribraziliensis TaxID=989973 RepID=A0ABR1LXC1_9PEZI